MKIRNILLVLALAISVPAMADITTLINAVETTATNINVPTSTNGNLLFKPCAEACEEKYVSVRLTNETRFAVGGKRVNFSDFRKEFYNRRRGGDTYALVSYDTAKNTVTSLNIGN